MLLTSAVSILLLLKGHGLIKTSARKEKNLFFIYFEIQSTFNNFEYFNF